MEEFTVNESLPYSQRKRILAYMEEHGSITTWEAMYYLRIMSPRKRLSEINAMTPLKKETVYKTSLDMAGHRKTIKYVRYSKADACCGLM